MGLDVDVELEELEREASQDTFARYSNQDLIFTASIIEAEYDLIIGEIKRRGIELPSHN